MHRERRLLVRVVNSEDGSEAWVEVAPAVARVLAEREPPLKEKLLREPKALEKASKTRAMASDGGEAWEGPHFRFDWLLGESATWAGPESVWLWDSEHDVWICRFCSHLAALSEIAYCLGCDRCGRDNAIPRPSKADLDRRREGRKAYRRGRLKGGQR